MGCGSIARRLAAALAIGAIFAVPAPASGEQGTTLSGQVVHSVTGKPVPKVTIRLENTGLQAVSGPDGSFRIENVPPGDYHVLVAAPGYMPTRVDVTVGLSPATVQVPVDPELHYTEVVSVSPDARSQFDSYQPTSVLAGQELTKHLEGQVGATVGLEPGVWERSFGPGPSRPVIRGLDGDRVLILQDGHRTGDLSSQSGDHGVPLNPAAASSIEVVRGPATLLYGANAIGGLVNVITNTIPTRPVEGMAGGFTVDLGSAASEGGGAGDFRWGNNQWALQVSGAGRRMGEVETPVGPIDNSQFRSGMASVGLAWTDDRGYFGGSYGYDDTRYGIPVIEEGELELTPRRHSFDLRGERSGFDGVFEAVRGGLAFRHYRHDELHEGDVETEFENDVLDLNVLGRHRPVGRLTGTLGASFRNRAFAAFGEEALSPPVDERIFALFLYEEVTWPHFTLQFGGRLDRANYRPAEDLPDRDFTNASGSIGVLYRPEAADDRITVALSLARAARHPALEELYFFGEHHGNFAFEIGNPDLRSERALGFDASLRWRHRRASGEVTYFRNSINDFIFRNPISEEEFEHRFGHHDHHDDELPFIEFVGADSLLQGFEAHADIEVVPSVIAELGFDYVRGQLRADNQPLPRIPPVRFRGGLRYQHSAFQAGGEVIAVGRQDRVAPEEPPTEGYNLLRLFGAYSFEHAGLVHTITARLDNAANREYRNHLSLIREFVPEMGRNFKLIYAVRF